MIRTPPFPLQGPRSVQLAMRVVGALVALLGIGFLFLGAMFCMMLAHLPLWFGLFMLVIGLFIAGGGVIVIRAGVQLRFRFTRGGIRQFCGLVAFYACGMGVRWIHGYEEQFPEGWAFAGIAWLFFLYFVYLWASFQLTSWLVPAEISAGQTELDKSDQALNVI